ncbi:MAG: hypothetical protein JXO44_12960, partial [Clostridia bacterium]|nr:hypothetical protein [Clostridia bacterium]
MCSPPPQSVDGESAEKTILKPDSKQIPDGHYRIGTLFGDRAMSASINTEALTRIPLPAILA